MEPKKSQADSEVKLMKSKKDNPSSSSNSEVKLMERSEDLENLKFEDFGGVNKILEDLKENLSFSLNHGHLLKHMGASLFCGIVIEGESGCGKTALGFAIANAYPNVRRVSPEHFDSGRFVKDLFSEPFGNNPSILYIDDIDGIINDIDEIEEKTFIMSKLVNCIEQYASKPMYPMVVIGSTKCAHSLPPKLLRFLNMKISLPVPDRQAREEIFRVVTKRFGIGYSPFDVTKISSPTNGFVGADFVLMAKKAQILVNKEQRALTISELEEILHLLNPVLVGKGWFIRPTLSWANVVGLDDLKAELKSSVIRLFKSAEYSGPCVLLFYGPQGCGKTLLAKAVASDIGANFIHANGENLMSGDTSKEIKRLFNRARMCSPCVFFIDQVHVLTDLNSAWVIDLLVELSREAPNDVIVICATDRLDLMTHVLRRPDRFWRCFHVPLPNANQRREILEYLLEDVGLNVDLDVIAAMECCKNLSGADLKSLVDQVVALKNKEIMDYEKIFKDALK